MRRNVGTLDAILRISIGLFGLAWAVSKAASRPRRRFPKWIAFFSAVKAAEGVTRFCPGLALFGLNTLDTHQSDTNRSDPSIGTRSEKAPPVHSQEDEQAEHRWSN